MLAKVTSKNQITIPKKVMEQMPDVKYFDLEVEGGVVILRPVRLYETNLEQIRGKIRKLGLGSNTVREAVEWARSK
jgi:bifunctional DNA-binding transcriptional regulator/antitoxin component of YhaV-PrlF toxin-antitoxin module